MMNSDSTTLNLYFRITYNKDEQDLSHLLNDQVPDWSIDNSRRMMLRDENFKPISNPDFKEQKDENGDIVNEIERYLTMPSFDYIKMMILDKNVPLKVLIQAYIAEEDRDGRFNF